MRAKNSSNRLLVIIKDLSPHSPRVDLVLVGSDDSLAFRCKELELEDVVQPSLLVLAELGIRHDVGPIDEMLEIVWVERGKKPSHMLNPQGFVLEFIVV